MGSPWNVRNHVALTVSASWRHRVNLTFEALERQGFAGLRDSKGLDESLPQTLRIAVRRSRSKAG
jgi:hypothetical protein